LLPTFQIFSLKLFEPIKTFEPKHLKDLRAAYTTELIQSDLMMCVRYYNHHTTTIIHKKSIPMKLSYHKKSNIPRPMREISRESVCGGETREKRRGAGV
jgi:hypothetical protein